MKYKRFYLTSGSILAILALIAPFIQFYYDYSDVTCGAECWTTFCMKNGMTNLYFYNYEELPLTFEPASSVHKVEFYKKDGRYKNGYRPIDFITPYSKGVKYVFKIPAYSRSCYGMKIFKDPLVTVKWTFAGLDPFLFGINANLSYEINSCYDNISLGGCFSPDWTKAFNQINFSDNVTIRSGNYSWNFTDINVTNVGTLLLNLTNNGSTNFTVSIRLNQTNPSRWQLNYIDNGTTFNITSDTLWMDIVNVTVNETKLINLSMDFFNISQTYINWTLNESTANWTFDFRLNVTAY